MTGKCLIFAIVIAAIAVSTRSLERQVTTGALMSFSAEKLSA